MHKQEILHKRQQVTQGKLISKRVVADQRRLIEYEIGDAKQPHIFHPQFKTKHWDNEVNFSARLLDTEPGQAVVSVADDGRIHWTKGNRTARFYDKPPAGHHFMDGGFEVEVEFAQKPASNVVVYTLQSKGLEFFYQDPARAEPGSVMADNVRGSYAAYHASKRDYRIGGKNYAAGKAFHIYRPEAKDAAGNTAWCELNITDALLTITVPQEFLDSAIYPVVVDPTFGYTAIGATASGSLLAESRANIGASMRYLASTGDTITKFSAYGDWGGSGSPSPIEVAAYDFNGTDPVNRLAAATTINLAQTAAWADSVALSQSLVNATTYVVAFAGKDGGTPVLYYDIGAGSERAGMSAALLPATWTTLDYSAAKFSLYATYTAGGGVNASFSLTLDTTFAGSASAGPAGVFALTLDATFAGSAFGSTAAGVLTTPVLKNNAGTILANESGVVANVYDATTGVLILRKTGLTSNASGIVSFTDASLVVGTTYAYEIVLAANGRRLPTVAAT